MSLDSTCQVVCGDKCDRGRCIESGWDLLKKKERMLEKDWDFLKKLDKVRERTNRSLEKKNEEKEIVKTFFFLLFIYLFIII